VKSYWELVGGEGVGGDVLQTASQVEVASVGSHVEIVVHQTAAQLVRQQSVADSVLQHNKTLVY